MALCGILLWRGALSSEVTERLQLKLVWSEVVPAVGGAGRHNTSGDGGRALGAAY
jgi:hypothetical protein